MSLSYQIVVEGLIEGGHPHLELCSNLSTAARRFDELAAKYPLYSINIYEFKKVLVKHRDGDKRVLPGCPRGHSGFANGIANVREGSNGLVKCSVCGWEEGC